MALAELYEYTSVRSENNEDKTTRKGVRVMAQWADAVQARKPTPCTHVKARGCIMYLSPSNGRGVKTGRPQGLSRRPMQLQVQ